MDKNFNYQERLRVIDEMIAQAKYRPGPADSIVTLLWGYLVSVAALIHWFLASIMEDPRAPGAWLLMLAGAVATAVINRKAKRHQRVKTYVDTLVSQVRLAFTISFAVLFFALQPDQEHFLPVVMMLYGVVQWVYGALIKFTAFKAGAAACWLGCGVAFFLLQEQQLLVLAAVVVLGYIVPGHLLLYKTKKSNV